MHVKLATNIASVKADLLVIGVFAQENIADVLAESTSNSISKPASKKDSGKNADQDLLDSLAKMALDEGFSGRAGQQVMLPTYDRAPFKRLLLIGLGNASDLNSSVFRKLGVQSAKRMAAISKKTPANVSLVLRVNPLKAKSKGQDKNLAAASLSQAAALEAVIEAWILSSFSFLKYKSVKDDDSSNSQRNSQKNDHSVLTLLVQANGLDQASLKKVSEKAIAMASATNMARTLIAEPPSYMTPTRLAAEAQRIASDHDLSVKILNPAQVEKLGMGALLGVAKGAKEPLRLIALKYIAPKSKKTIGLIGKGITFDSGGLSLKTAVGMEHMKYDMAGAAAVLAAMQVIGQLKPNVSVLAVVASTENMPGSAALHPGDVLKSMNGKTIEVNNTDAEGRLILADAITYAIREGVDELIDIATLTGAVVSALGRVAAGIMGSDQTLVDNVIASGKICGEQFWQLPLFVEYKEGLKSDIADLKNAGSRGEAGSSSAAMFLKEFTEGKPWAHLDIAGVGWLDRERDEICKGGTGFGARTLSNYVLSQAKNKA
ncbi:MAG: leucyl aminopeptidase [Candidatus Melainabacteria bacterium]|nr:leucyl aminopeptidase [Candidatus Melainabacteria bacterium]